MPTKETSNATEGKRVAPSNAMQYFIMKYMASDDYRASIRKDKGEADVSGRLAVDVDILRSEARAYWCAMPTSEKTVLLGEFKRSRALADVPKP